MAACGRRLRTTKTSDALYCLYVIFVTRRECYTSPRLKELAERRKRKLAEKTDSCCTMINSSSLSCSLVLGIAGVVVYGSCYFLHFFSH